MGSRVMQLTTRHLLTLRDRYGASVSQGVPVYSPDFAGAHLPVDVWPGRVDLAGWLYIEKVAHPSTDWPNVE